MHSAIPASHIWPARVTASRTAAAVPHCPLSVQPSRGTVPAAAAPLTRLMAADTAPASPPQPLIITIPIMVPEHCCLAVKARGLPLPQGPGSAVSRDKAFSIPRRTPRPRWCGGTVRGARSILWPNWPDRARWPTSRRRSCLRRTEPSNSGKIPPLPQHSLIFSLIFFLSIFLSQILPILPQKFPHFFPLIFFTWIFIEKTPTKIEFWKIKKKFIF